MIRNADSRQKAIGVTVAAATTPPTPRIRVENELIRGLTPLARSWRTALDDRLTDLGLSSATGWTLLLIDQLGDAVRQIDLASALDINSASLVRLIDALVSLGYVERVFDPVDRRVRRVRLLDMGRVVAGEVERAVAALRREVLAGLSDAELDVALHVAHRIGRSLDARRA